MSSVGIRRDILLRIIRMGVHEACLELLRRKRRKWVRQWIERRDLLGASSRLICELAAEDPNSYLNMLRLSELKFNDLLEMVTPLTQKKDTNMRQAIPCKTKLEITLRFLATGDSLKSLQYLFRVPHNTISTFLPEVLGAIYTALQPFIQVPRTAEEWKSIQKGFELMWNFPNCCGALDGKHIRIVRPRNSTSMYFNYKGFYSIVLFAMVDAEYRFTFIDVGSDGRANDSTIFKCSQLNTVIENNLLDWPINGLCVGDDAFPLRNNLFTPYSHRQLTLEERVFNYRLSRARRVSENAFGILVARFRVFTRPIHLSVDTIELVVKAACALHNWQISARSGRYIPSGSVDTEDLNSGQIIPGSWRNEVLPMVDLKKVSIKNYSHEVKRIRNRYAKAFMTDLQVPWQLKSIAWESS